MLESLTSLPILGFSAGGGGAFKLAIGSPISGGTNNSVLFVNPAGIIAQDNPNFTYASGVLTTPSLSLGTNALLTQDAADIIAQRRGTIAQLARFYRTFTDINNNEWVDIGNDGTNFRIRCGQKGTGAHRPLFIGYDQGVSNSSQVMTFVGGSGAGAETRFNNGGSDCWKINTSGTFLGIIPTAGLGYGAGAGGTIVQATSKATGVTLNTVCGTITLNNASLAADTTVAFTLTDSAIAATDCVHVQHDSVGTLGAYSFGVTPAAGSAVISVHNCTPGALAEAIVLRFAVIKAVIA